MRKKLIALVAVIAWCSFWAFGALAVSAPGSASVVPLMLVAFAGMAGGVVATLWLQRRDYKDLLTGKV
jgi:hypothetical protein